MVTFTKDDSYIPMICWQTKLEWVKKNFTKITYNFLWEDWQNTREIYSLKKGQAVT